ncbi:hypothetical protein [Roseinatronobacter sp.]
MIAASYRGRGFQAMPRAEGLDNMTLPDTTIVDRTSNAAICTQRSINVVHCTYGGQDGRLVNSSFCRTLLVL